MRMFHLIVSLLGLFLVFQARAQSVAQPGHECSFVVAIPEYVCLNPVAGTDLRLYVTEYQTCDNGKITELDRNIKMMEFKTNNGKGKDKDFDDVQVKLSDKRTHMDDRADDLTIVLPTSAQAQDGKNTIQMQFTEKQELDNADSDQKHYIGSFRKVDASGKVLDSGKLICGVF